MNRNKYKHLLVVLITLGLGIGLSACGWDGATQVTRYQDLRLQFQTNRTYAGPGDQVQMHFTVTNIGKQPVQINSQNGPVLNIKVYDVNGGEILFSWAALYPDQAATQLVWQPGETKTIDAIWTVTQKEYYSGRSVNLEGSLNEGTEIVQAAGMQACLGTCER
ncbi:MAG: BsuPI-related putative proteinase inhibitor [Anaerolineae bacterium]